MATVTRKLYYEDVYMTEAKARVIDVTGNMIVLDASCFYPEGGGQVGDRGWIGSLRVCDTQKRGGVVAASKGLPTVSINTEIVHYIEGSVDGITPGDEVPLRIDEEWRRGCMNGHGAAHLVLGAIADMFGADSFFTTGCHIVPTQARLDLRTEHKFGGATLEEIQARVNAWITTGAPVSMKAVENMSEMFIWSAHGLGENLQMPCGGTHHPDLRSIGPVRLKRRREGKGLERIYISPADAPKEVPS
jgi:alanyl-tRNA synthetase